MKKIKLNLKGLNKKINQAFDGTVRAYAEQMQTEIESDKWDWPGTTKRRNKSVVGSPRDAVDMGDLVESQRPPVISEADGVRKGSIVYDADHAAVVHEGWTDAQDVYPGRRFSETALEELDVTKDFGDRLRSQL